MDLALPIPTKLTFSAKSDLFYQLKYFDSDTFVSLTTLSISKDPGYVVDPFMAVPTSSFHRFQKLLVYYTSIVQIIWYIREVN
jgi:hypothetical protein